MTTTKRASSVDSANPNSRVQSCGVHDFTTDDPEKFNKHMAGPGHYAADGQIICFYCKELFQYKASDKIPSIRVINGTAMHPKCSKQFAKENDIA